MANPIERIERIEPIKDKLWLALTSSLEALTKLLRYAAGEDTTDSAEAMRTASEGIRTIMVALEDYNV